MRRHGPRPVGHALGTLTDRLAPATLLAEVQRAWPAAAGSEFRHPYAEPVHERDGIVTVHCPEATRANELDLMSELVIAKLNTGLAPRAVRALRVKALPLPASRA